MSTSHTLVTSRTRIFIPFIILPDSEDEDTTLPVRSALLPPLPLAKMTGHDVEALDARAEATEQRAETLQISLDLLRWISQICSSRNNANYESRDEFRKIKQIVAQRVTDVIEAITIYEKKTCMARDSIDQLKCEYETKNPGNGPKMKKTQILTRLYDVTPTIFLLCNLFKARHVIQQHSGVTTRKVYAVTLLLWMAGSSESAFSVTWTLDYAVTSFKLVRWKVGINSLQRKPQKGYIITYSKSINRGLIQTNQHQPFHHNFKKRPRLLYLEEFYQKSKGDHTYLTFVFNHSSTASVGKRLLYVKGNKAISLGKGASKVSIELQHLSLKDCTCHEYLNDIEEEYQARALLASLKDSLRRVPKGSAVQKQITKLNATNVARKDEEEVSSGDNEMVEVKVLMALAEENNAISKACTRNGKWVKISMRKVHTLLETKDNDNRKTYLDYLCIDLSYVKEQRTNLLSKHRDHVHELNAYKEQLLVLKQAKLDFLTMQHVNTEILKKNKNLRTEPRELKAITERWINSYNKVNQCINEQIPFQNKNLRVDQLTEDPSSSGKKDLVFVKSSVDDTKVSIPVYIHNHKDHLGKFEEKDDDGYLFRYSVVSKALRVFNTRRQQTEETYHITFDESPDTIKFLKPSVDNINIAENERYLPDEYLHPYEPSQRNPGAGMLTRAMAKELGAASTHECLVVDFISKEEPKNVSEALQHPGWVDAMQDELNQFPINKV
nr:retrovirus-related Pol polyprotein from transposon TNT 1-94 [Tanacetum cinerariifolium]